MKQYKNHIALFFAILFTVSQFYHTVHTFIEKSHHHCVGETFVAKEKTTDNSGYKILKSTKSFGESHHCAICQQLQSFKIYFANNTLLEIKKSTLNSFKTIYHRDFLFSAYLLENQSLRGPPSFFL